MPSYVVAMKAHSIIKTKEIKLMMPGKLFAKED